MAEKQLPIRLFVGGLPANVTAQQLAGRFASFGTLAALDLVPDKLDSGTARCRGFAYIDFLPQNDQALHRCISLVSSAKQSSYAALDCRSAEILFLLCSTMDANGLVGFCG